MNSTFEQIKELERQLQSYPNGYISRKVINGKERFYLQWTENGKLKSKYIKSDEVDKIRSIVEERRQLEHRLRELKSSPEGKELYNQKRKEVRSMQNITGTLMSEDRPIAKIKDGEITESTEQLLPFYLKRTGNVEGWLASRAIDAHRTNARLLKRALRLRSKDDVSTVLAVNAATITDRFWFRPDGSEATYSDIRFRENHFDKLALRGDPDSFSQRPSRTPELTNTGSFEKCWRLIDGKWWMYKSGNDAELFSELFISKLSEALGFPTAHYELDGGYIRSKDFTDGASVNFEPMRSLVDDDEDYGHCFDVLYAMSPDLARQYLVLIYMDSICCNMDRHTENFGFLRDTKTGEVLSLAPNYDNNIALIARGYPSDISRKNDGLIRFFEEFLAENEAAHEMYRNMKLPTITEDMIDKCMAEIPIEVNRDFIRAFILNGQTRVREIIDTDEIVSEDEDVSTGLWL